MEDSWSEVDPLAVVESPQVTSMNSGKGYRVISILGNIFMYILDKSMIMLNMFMIIQLNTHHKDYSNRITCGHFHRNSDQVIQVVTHESLKRLYLLMFQDIICRRISLPEGAKNVNIRNG